jgi:hypothetical protein
MKKLFVCLFLMGFVLTGCAGMQGGVSQDAALLTAIELGGYNLGYYVGKSKTDADDVAIANAYALARTGTLTPAQLAEAFSKFKIENAQLAGSLLIILRNMGATFDAGGGLIGLSGIPVEYWDRAAAGYASGYEFGKMGQKAIKPSAVVAKMPKRK